MSAWQNRDNNIEQVKYHKSDKLGESSMEEKDWKTEKPRQTRYGKKLENAAWKKLKMVKLVKCFGYHEGQTERQKGRIQQTVTTQCYFIQLNSNR